MLALGRFRLLREVRTQLAHKNGPPFIRLDVVHSIKVEPSHEKDMKETITANKNQDKEHRLPCGRCLVDTRHKVLQSVEVSGNDEGFQYSEDYQIVQCQGCESVSFRRSVLTSEDLHLDEETGETYYTPTSDLYPTRVAGRHRLRQVYFLPPAVFRIYNETHSALCNKQPILAGVGIRALVETVCNEKAAVGGNLEQKIDNLVTIGVLTQNGAETLHSMRILGNAAAHQVMPHSEETLGLAMDVVEHMLTDVYVLPAATQNLPKRKPSALP